MPIYDVDTLTPITAQNIVPAVGGTDYDKTMYGFWSKIFLFYFTILVYSTLYISIVQQAFQLIYYLPDKVLRWIGGAQDQLGSGAVQGMTREVKSKADEGGQAAKGSMMKAEGTAMNKSLGALSGGQGGDGGSGSSSSEASK